MNRKSKAFWEQVRGAYERGEGSYQELAERFGVSKRTICSHGKDEAWKKRSRFCVRSRGLCGR